MTRARQVTEDNRAWIAGLGDEGGSGSWLAAMMTQLVRPDSAEVSKLQRFVDGVLWGGLQYADGPRKYGVRKSMFYYEPDSMPPGTYSDSIRYGGWSSWNREHAMSVGRSYDYPHVAAAYWVLYRNARNHVGLVTNHEWDWYLDHAWRTAEAMVRLAPDYARFGQMEGTVFVMVLADMRREGWDARADSLEGLMRQRALEWKAMAYPFGSEMPWDSTGQEEVYAWCRYFGFDDKALVTLNAILGYMPTVPHWGYNGSARRYWDFQYAGKLRRVERQLHHYGSGLNAIPVLSEYRLHPDDLYLLRVGYGGLLGSIANVTEDGFGPSGFHAWPEHAPDRRLFRRLRPGLLRTCDQCRDVRHARFDVRLAGVRRQLAGRGRHRRGDAARRRALAALHRSAGTLDHARRRDDRAGGDRGRPRAAHALAGGPVHAGGAAQGRG